MMKNALLAFAFVLFGAVMYGTGHLTAGHQTAIHQQPSFPYEFKDYVGSFGNYSLRIEPLGEAGEGRMVHLEAKPSMFAKNAAVPVAVTGHSFGDGHWDRIFIASKDYGFNSVLLKPDGTYTWEPCPADEGKVQPFTKEQIADAETMLNKAIATAPSEYRLL